MHFSIYLKNLHAHLLKTSTKNHFNFIKFPQVWYQSTIEIIVVSFAEFKVKISLKNHHGAWKPSDKNLHLNL
jgi:hypothetical protein